MQQYLMFCKGSVVKHNATMLLGLAVPGQLQLSCSDGLQADVCLS